MLEQLTALNLQVAELDQQRAAPHRSPAWQEAQLLQQQLTALAYDAQAHGQLRQALRAAQGAPLQYQSLVQARMQQPLLDQELAELQQQALAIAQDLSRQNAAIAALETKLDQAPDPSPALADLTEQIDQRRHRLDAALADQGRLHQRQQQLAALEQQQAQQQQQIQQCRHQQRIHQELAQAFGKNGIQALMIETVLPQLEQETNRILARLSDHQLHVQFITQKAKRQGKPQAALLDTLDIRIADARGTRPYETFSGGEAFRVNFSIRLALARLLAQRSGTALQLLIVDEGFGTQDGEGCDRLIAAINGIAPDFACILTITHMPQFKEAFQARIEVTKTLDGSQLSLAT